MSRWVQLGQLSEFREDRPVRVAWGDVDLVLVRHRGNVYAWQNRCPHAGCLLSEGMIKAEELVCLCHGSRFGVADGRLLEGPASHGLRGYRAEVRGSTLFVEI